MAIAVCVVCLAPKVVPGPRNEKRKGFCGSEKCTIRGLLNLAAEDECSREEADYLNKLLGG